MLFRSPVMISPVHLQRLGVVAVVDCLARGQLIRSRSLKPDAPQLICLFQEALIDPQLLLLSIFFEPDHTGTGGHSGSSHSFNADLARSATSINLNPVYPVANSVHPKTSQGLTSLAQAAI